MNIFHPLNETLITVSRHAATEDPGELEGDRVEQQKKQKQNKKEELLQSV